MHNWCYPFNRVSLSKIWNILLINSSTQLSHRYLWCIYWV